MTYSHLHLVTIISLALGVKAIAQCNFPSVNQSTCSGTTVNATPSNAPAGTTYTWPAPIVSPTGSISGAASSTSSQTSISLTLTNNSTAPAIATYTITPLGPNCSNPQPFTVVVTVNPIPLVNPVANQNICAGQLTTAINFTSNLPGAQFSPWSNNEPLIGIESSGDGSIPPFTVFNNTAFNLTASITIRAFTNECLGPLTTVTSITAKPIPQVLASSNQSHCAGQQSEPIIFTSNIPGTIFQWSSSNLQVGLPPSGSGNIISPFTTQNITNDVIQTIISVVPTFNGCSGPSSNVTQLTVRPVPFVNLVSNQSVCNGGLTQTINFTSNISSATFSSWTNSNPNIGLPPNGNGNVAPFNGYNSTTTPETGEISVTPSAFGCTGAATLVTSITIRPSPTVSSVDDISVCQNEQVITPAFNASIPNPQFEWFNNNSSIGLQTSGTGSIGPFTGLNNNNFTNFSNITFSASESGTNCASGPPQSFQIGIKPRPMISLSNPEIQLCSGSLVDNLVPASSLSNTEFHWSHNFPNNLTLPSSGDSVTLPPFSISNSSDSTLQTQLLISGESNGCSGNSVTANVSIYPLPQLLGASDLSLCNGEVTEKIEFSPSLINTIVNWQNSNPSIGLQTNGDDFTLPSFTALNTGDEIEEANIQFTLLSDEGCYNHDSITISVFPINAQPDASFNTQIDLLTITLSLNNPDGVSDVQWNFGDGNTSSFNPVTHTYSSAGSYTITCSVSNACGFFVESYQVTEVSNVGISEAVKSILNIYPNPVNERLYLQLGENIIKQNEPATLEITDLSGKLIEIIQISSDESLVMVSTAFIPKGFYFIKLHSSNQTFKNSFLKL